MTEVAAAPRPDPGVEAGRPESPPVSSPAPRERAFVLDADLGRVKLHLDFVVYKPSAPFAGINGQQVVPGSIVEGWLVEEIGRDSVRLSDGRGKVVLRTR
ncbi:MAG TPA: hypothetical protein PLS53_13485 [Thermoanaerobaculaceae bacterium]|nr:hypothetical protein [Thermoanaerobaculaceae bacterium]